MSVLHSIADPSHLEQLIALQAATLHKLTVEDTGVGDYNIQTDSIPTTRRADFPAQPANKKANIQQAIAVTRSAAARSQAVLALTTDYYANSSTAPRDSLWKTWCKLAHHWDKPPLPVDTELVICLGASFKAGAYMSVKNYFSRARSAQFEQLGTSWDPAVEHTVRKVQRSVLRSLGGSKKKAGFPVETLRNELPALTVSASAVRGDDPLQYSSPIQDDVVMVILGCWFLLRGIELAAAEVWHLTVDTRNKTVKWLLPVSKTDPRAIGTARSHGCCCTAASPQSICPYHLAKYYIDKTRAQFGDEHFGPELGRPLFPSSTSTSENLSFMAKSEVAKAVVKCAAMAGEPITEWSPTGLVTQRFAEHAMRVSGAQMLARAGVSLHLIKLLGRWGSDAVERYVQDAALCRQTLLASQTICGLGVANIPDSDSISHSFSSQQSARVSATDSATKSLLQSLQEQIQQLNKNIQKLDPSQNRFIHNIAANILHVRLGEENATPPATWHTKCGWKYAFSNFSRCNKILPAFLLCSKCNTQDLTTLSSSSSASS